MNRWINNKQIFCLDIKSGLDLPKDRCIYFICIKWKHQCKVTLTLLLLLFKLYYGINIRNLRTNRMYRMSKKSHLTNYISICEINAPNISVQVNDKTARK